MTYNHCCEKGAHKP